MNTESSVPEIQTLVGQPEYISSIKPSRSVSFFDERDLLSPELEFDERDLESPERDIDFVTGKDIADPPYERAISRGDSNHDFEPLPMEENRSRPFNQDMDQMGNAVFSQLYLMYNYGYIVVFFGTCYFFMEITQFVFAHLDNYNNQNKHAFGYIATTILYLCCGEIFHIFLVYVKKQLKESKSFSGNLPVNHERIMRPPDTDHLKKESLPVPMEAINLLEGAMVYFALQFASTDSCESLKFSDFIGYIPARFAQGVIMECIFYMIYLNKKFEHNNAKFNRGYEQDTKLTPNPYLTSCITLAVTNAIIIGNFFNLSNFFVVVMLLWPLYASIAVRLPQNTNLISRFCDFFPMLDSLLGIEPLNVYNSKHFFIGSTNFGFSGLAQELIEQSSFNKTWKSFSKKNEQFAER